MNNNNTQSALRLQESRLNRANNQIGSQLRIQQLRDDPIAAGHLVRYQSYLGRVNQFEKNALTLSDQFTVREGYMTDSLDIMQRVRELAVTGASIPVSCSASFLWAAQSPNIPLSSCPLSSCARCFKHRPLPHDLYIKQLETCRFRKHCVTLQAAK